jgi:hypothetical protein
LFEENRMLTTHKSTRRTAIRCAAITWLAVLTLIFTAASVAFAAPLQQSSQAATKALAWMRTQQQPDGSFAGFGAGSTIDALLAIVAAGQDPAAFAQGANTPTTFLQAQAANIAKAPGGAGKLLIAAHALGMDGKSFGGVDLVRAVQATYGISETGQYGPDAVGHAFSILGLKAAGVEPEPSTIQRLLTLQAPEGGWAFAGAGKPDTNTTSVAVQALLATGSQPTSAPLQKALAYLLSQRNNDGGYPYQQGGDFGSDSDANSTAYVSQALTALGASSDAAAANAFLLPLQNPSGAFVYQKSMPDDNAGATYQVVPALLGATLLNPAPAPVPVAVPPATPGMPTTGIPTDIPVAAFILSAFVLITLGITALRKATPR